MTDTQYIQAFIDFLTTRDWYLTSWAVAIFCIAFGEALEKGVRYDNEAPMAFIFIGSVLVILLVITATIRTLDGHF